MTDPEPLTDQQQRDAHLVRQTEALEKIARRVDGIHYLMAWWFWLTMGAALLALLFFGTGGGSIL